MFNIGITELVVVLLTAFLVVGPKDLPKVARWIARMLKKIRAFVAEVKKETGWDEVEAELNQTGSEIGDTLKDMDIRDELRDANHNLQRSLNSVQQDVRKLDKEEKEARAAGARKPGLPGKNNP